MRFTMKLIIHVLMNEKSTTIIIYANIMHANFVFVTHLLFYMLMQYIVKFITQNMYILGRG